MFWRWWRPTPAARLPEFGIDGPLRVEVEGENRFPCPCCGDDTLTLVGWVSTHSHTIAGYHFRWIPGQLGEHGATILLFIGPWGGDEASDRWVARIEVRWPSGRPEMMVVDAEPAPGLADHALTRREALAPLCRAPLFRVVDAIWEQDPRLAEVRAFGSA